jgi:hypothetical protein
MLSGRPLSSATDDAYKLDSVAGQVRMRLKNMSAHIIEIGRELLAMKRRLGNDRFLKWVTAACDLAPAQAQRMMRAAKWAEGREAIVSQLEPTAIYLLAAPSTPEAVWQEVLSLLAAGQRPAPRIIRAMIRAAKGDPLGPLPDSKEDEIEGLLKYCGYKGVPDHLAQSSATATKGTQRAVYQNGRMDAEATTPGASPSTTDAGSEEIANVL